MLGWKQRAGLEMLADGMALFVGEDALVVRDEAGQRTVDGDPEAARVAVDRAFVDAVRGVGTTTVSAVPYAEACAPTAWPARSPSRRRPARRCGSGDDG